jgi:hypothetical protein
MTDEVTSPKAVNPIRTLAKTMWLMDTKGTYETAEERREAFVAIKKVYMGKAKRLAKMLEKRDVTLVVSETASDDA